MFLDAKGNVIPGKQISSRNRSSRNDSWCFAVHAKLGSLPIEAILKPVIELAEKGVIVTQKQEERLNHYHDELNKTNGPNSVLSKVYKEKDTIKYPALAATLRRISKNGRDSSTKEKQLRL
jgi:gamma-glutamyltranspeptidase/glutathione hydrolase